MNASETTKTENADKVTPRPWIVGKYGDGINNILEGLCVVDNSSMHKYENMSHIVRCVNAHDALVVALHDVLRFWEKSGACFGEVSRQMWEDSYAPMNNARKALALANAD